MCGILLSIAACGDGTGPDTDGRALLFSGRGGDGDDVYVVSVESGEVRRLTTDGMSTGAEWSPDGDMIVFESRRELTGLGSGQIFLMNADGSNQRRLSENGESDDARAAWSPDGSRILFTRGSELHVMNRDGSNVRPKWRPQR
jgi:TolB protein